LHITGKSEYNDIVGSFEKQGIAINGKGNIIIKPYLYEMPKALAIADLAIFRAGAIGLAELTSYGIPAILVPYPYAAENHQEYNAKVISECGAAIVIRDADLSGEKLLKITNELISSPEKLALMKSNSLTLGRPEAAYDIARLALQLSLKN
jgi:UDP-N-acetylglucosamine--N-acetylmuramyl-(pentapeptide) pyrophosphoryl-undecaprenol N-acetylglucosamine transferase